MKNTIKSIFAAVAATFAVSVFATAPSASEIAQFVPDMMNYQGYLANPSTGAAYTDGIYELDIRLYRSQTGGTAIWGARYSVYVKGGYFNIMLGDSNASRIYSTTSNSSYPTYNITELRRALWNDTSVSQNYNLWLGVTPRQSPTHASIANPTEIAPRQQLLAAPYAFRTMSAKYAEASYGDFTVDGKLTVSGSLQFPSSYSFNGVSYISSMMKLAGTSQTSSNPSLYLYGNYMYLYPYGKVEIKPQSGNIVMTVGSSYSAEISGGSKFSASGTQVSLSSAGGGTTIGSTGGNIELSVSSGQGVYGTGNLRWTTPGKSSPVFPFKFLEKRGLRFGSSSLIETDGDFNWSIIGFHYHKVGGSGEAKGYYVKKSSGKWYVCAEKSGGSDEDSYTVQLLGVSKAFSYDERAFDVSNY